MTDRTELLTTGRWFLQGAKGITSLPAIILMMSFIGFCTYASQSGMTLVQTVFMTGVVWALPAKIILVSSMSSGASLLTAFIAVTLSSVRLMPMVASLMPEIRNAKTPTWKLLAVSHFIAITAWVFMMLRLDRVPRENRLAYFAGFAITLTLTNMLIVALTFRLVTQLPPLVAGSLYFLTPMYFMTSVWESARHRVIYVALLTGMIASPLAYLAFPEFDILVSGIGGGTLAYGLEYGWRKYGSRT
jgi:predicted branched-subunit amino acid permease